MYNLRHVMSWQRIVDKIPTRISNYRLIIITYIELAISLFYGFTLPYNYVDSGGGDIPACHDHGDPGS